jgi:hypothetical protein
MFHISTIYHIPHINHTISFLFEHDMAYNDDQCETIINVFVSFIRENNVNMGISWCRRIQQL